MNLMFRKGFRDGGGGKSGGGGCGGGGGLKGSKSFSSGRNANKQRARDMSLSLQDDVHYRTHLFFSPGNRPNYADNEEPRCGPLSGASGSPIACALTSDADAPSSSQFLPLVDRRPSVSMLLKWGDRSTPTAAARQVTFGGGGGGGVSGGINGGYGVVGQNGHKNGNVTSGITRTEPVSLSSMTRDCFIIPMQSINRFLPEGIPLPAPNETDKNGPLSVLEVSDPKICILAHLMSPLEPLDPMLESPTAHPLLKQRAVASELVAEIQQANSAVGGMLLANMERNNVEFPFIAYYVINTTQTDPSHFYTGVRNSSLVKFDPKNLRYTAAHTLDLYSEVASICRPPLVLSQNETGHLRKSQTASTGYIISVYKVFEGDDGERFERNWLYWTGARTLYRYLPRTAGLRRISLHKSTSSKGDKMYLLVCECADLLKDISAASVLIPALRARLCGYTGLYRPIHAF